MDNKNAKPGDINEDGLEIEQDGWITRANFRVIGGDNRLIDETPDAMIQLEERR